jgi:isopropylmalate/homocitrate/citramalate synthase
MPPRVTVYEVGPRDGLQNRVDAVPADVKVQFVDLLSQAGFPAIEVTSFVRPGAIPQLADAEQLVASITRSQGTRYIALVPNMRGMERARTANLGGVAVFTAASETFSRRNTNASIDETLQRFAPVLAEAGATGLWRRGYVSTAFGCPYEGAVDTQAVVRVAVHLAQLGVDELSIGDTIGVATPSDVERVCTALLKELPADRIALHFHDTRGTALANVLAGLQLGITTFDSSAGGLGGCPYAPGAAGNLATEDLLYMLHGLGIETGIDLDQVVAASRYLGEATGRMPAGRYLQAALA